MSTLPTTLRAGDTRFGLRRAVAEDLPAIVTLLTDDPLGRHREGADLEPYRRAFAAVDADPAHLLLVVTQEPACAVVGTLQLTVLPGLSRGGATRLQVEGVRVRADHRGSGLGTAVLEWALAEGRRRGCALVQLTTDTSRPDALRFYERLGFAASHVGLKRAL
ncbi:GNAT family N-acetyltransferase [Geodermatophilus sp. SYSU D01186]